MLLKQIWKKVYHNSKIYIKRFLYQLDVLVVPSCDISRLTLIFIYLEYILESGEYYISLYFSWPYTYNFSYIAEKLDNLLNIPPFKELFHWLSAQTALRLQLYVKKNQHMSNEHIENKIKESILIVRMTTALSF